jgi:hypothetical protein
VVEVLSIPLCNKDKEKKEEKKTKTKTKTISKIENRSEEWGKKDAEVSF